MRRIAATLAVMLALPAVAQVKVGRPPAAPAAVSAEQAAQLSRREGELNSIADDHDRELAAFAAVCPPMPKSDPRLPECQSKRQEVLARIRPYNAELRSYRDEARSILMALVAQLDREVASIMDAIRNLRFDTTTAAFEQWEDLSQQGKDAMVDETIGALFDTLGPGSEIVGAKLGKVFDKMASKKLIAPTSWNPYNINRQISELKRLGVTNPEFHRLLRKVAAVKDKREYVESAQALFAYGNQLYKEDQSVHGIEKSENWRQRNWAILSACLTFLDEKDLLLPEKVVAWVGTQAGKKMVGSIKAAASAANVTGHYILLDSLTENLGNASRIPEQQLIALKSLEMRLKDAVERRNAARTEINRFS